MMMKQLLMIACAVALAALFTIQASAKEITLRGKLVQTVEAGGWIIQVDAGNGAGRKYLLLNAQRFQNERWFRVGAEVEATGKVKRGVMTIYQEGTPFEARRLRPVRNKRMRN